MDAVGIGRGFRRPFEGVVQRFATLLRFARDIEQGHCPVGAGDPIEAVAIFDVRGSGFQHVGGGSAALVDDGCGQAQHRRAADRHGAGTAGHAGRGAVRIALEDADILGVDAELADRIWL